MEEVVQSKTVADPQISTDEEKKEKIVNIDFKMVTFSLAGKDYAVDIMNVKEIVKGGRYTYVPNTAPFVLGVYNLRGDIIPIIDLRLFFNIEVEEKKASEIDNVIILVVEDKTFGVVVDAVDKVVGIQKSTIQPPHPLFGDINIKYIYGVVESNNRLYVLLDVDRIFTDKPRESLEEFKAKGDVNAVHNMSRQKVNVEGKSINDILKGNVSAKAALSQVPSKAESSGVKNGKDSDKNSGSATQPKDEKVDKAEVDFSFIAEGLANFKHFYVTDINKDWVKERFDSWASERGSATTQLTNERDATEFLRGFSSPCTDTFWTSAYSKAIYDALPDNSARQIVVWNPGCGKGYESYSLACILKDRYPNAKIKVFAQDMDLLNVSGASLLSVPDNFAKDWYSPYVVKNVSGGYTFSQEIKDIVLFEYHDCSHTNTVPSPDLIFCRDMVSFSTIEDQNSILSDFEEKLKDNGTLILGENESLDANINWSGKLVGNICVYSK